jgi:hypothetical protein
VSSLETAERPRDVDPAGEQRSGIDAGAIVEAALP